jgi:hypothetical protein
LIALEVQTDTPDESMTGPEVGEAGLEAGWDRPAKHTPATQLWMTYEGRDRIFEILRE